MSSASVLVTGGAGFLGSALVSHLVAKGGLSIFAAVRDVRVKLPLSVELRPVTGLTGDVDWSGTLAGIDAVIHAAARVHVMSEQAADPLAEFRLVNVEGTLNLARQAAAAGVRRFIFISSIKVNGESTPPGEAFTAEDLPAPVDPYGISKLEAEQGLLDIARSTSMEVVIIRPVLIYGPGVKANFRSLLSWVSKGIPLPLGSIFNSRSLLALDNLLDLISVCIHHPNAANQIFLASDGEDVSTTVLLRKIGVALGRPARLLPLSSNALSVLMRLLGRPSLAQRLLGSLQVDIGKNARLLDWTPPVKMNDALRATAHHYLEHRKK